MTNDTLRTFGPPGASTLDHLKPGQYFCRYDFDFREHFSGKCAECGRVVNEGDAMEITQVFDFTFNTMHPYESHPQPTEPGEGMHCAEHMARR